MNRIFRPRGYFRVPDGTEVSPFLNSTDAMQTDVPWGQLGDMSLASGRLEPGSSSWIHSHPAVTQITYVTAGVLTVKMRERQLSDAYELSVGEGEAVVSEPGTLLQLRNGTDKTVEVLYMVSPSYAFEGAEGKPPVHDDSVLVARSWEELLEPKTDLITAHEKSDYEARAGREECLRRLAAKKGQGPAPLSEEDVVPLKERHDYLAPDGLEIRLLVEGEKGGLAHCTLPPGGITSAVRHRTVEELWYVIAGEGEFWRKRDDEKSRVDSIRAGDSLRIPVGTRFQFRASRDHPLELLLATMPSWPGKQDAVPSAGAWLP